MRKINSEFKAAFISESGSELINNDYFGFVELDNFACYVIADGLHKGFDSEGARRAITAVINAFGENPSIRKSALKRYMQAANDSLMSSDTKRQSLKASVTVVVTNYEAIRYAVAGNTRMTMYRSDNAFIKSADTTLAQDMVNSENESNDKLATHIERNNMYAYLGQRSNIKPFISKKIRLKESDVITLFTRGIWENVDDGELQDVFSETTDDPQESIDTVEELLLSRQPKELENYTFVAIFINKVFVDPERKKKRKKIIIIAIIVFVVAVIVTVAIILWTRHVRQLRADMNEHFSNAVTHIERGSFQRAQDDIIQARDLSRRLRDNDKTEYIVSHILLIDAVLRGNELLDNNRFTEAQEVYLSALNYALYVGNIGAPYVYNRLTTTERFIDFFTLIELADSLAELSNYEVALSLYIEARAAASAMFFADGRQQAIDGISDMLARITAAQEAAEAIAAAQAERETAETAVAQQAAQELAASTVAAAELKSQGDQHFFAGEYDASLAFFQSALEMHLELGNIPGADLAAARVELSENRLAERILQAEIAAEHAQTADIYFAEGNFSEAIRHYTIALQLFENVGIDWRVAQMTRQLESARQAERQIEQQETERAEQERRERQEREDRAIEYAAMGTAHFELSNFDAAIHYYTEARRIYEQLGVSVRLIQIDVRLDTIRRAAIEYYEAQAAAAMAAQYELEYYDEYEVEVEVTEGYFG